MEAKSQKQMRKAPKINQTKMSKARLLQIQFLSLHHQTQTCRQILQKRPLPQQKSLLLQIKSLHHKMNHNSHNKVKAKNKNQLMVTQVKENRLMQMGKRQKVQFKVLGRKMYLPKLKNHKSLNPSLNQSPHKLSKLSPNLNKLSNLNKLNPNLNNRNHNQPNLNPSHPQKTITTIQTKMKENNKSSDKRVNKKTMMDNNLIMAMKMLMKMSMVMAMAMELQLFQLLITLLLTPQLRPQWLITILLKHQWWMAL